MLYNIINKLTEMSKVITQTIIVLSKSIHKRFSNLSVKSMLKIRVKATQFSQSLQLLSFYILDRLKGTVKISMDLVPNQLSGIEWKEGFGITRQNPRGQGSEPLNRYG